MVAALGLLLLSSCLGGREEIWIEKDGSGRMETTYEVPGFAIASLGGETKLRGIIEAFFAKEPGVHLDEFVVEKKESQAVLSMKARFDSVLDLKKLMDQSKEEGGKDALPKPIMKLFGDIKVQREGMSVDFQRSIDPREVFAGGLVSPSQEQMKGYKLEYIMHLPTKASRSNAHEVRNDGHTLVWSYALADAMKQPAETNFVAPIPVPWWVAGLAMVLVLSPVVWWWRRRKRAAMGNLK
jgi:hypothetical protein